jgi:archaetidylinositol phosphate synthase
MVLDLLRKEMELVLRPLTGLLSAFPPDLFTMLSLVFAIAAGVLYWASGLWVPEGRYPWLLLGALAMVGLNSIADSLDGSIARRTGRTTAAGDFLDHTFDRFSDILILAGIALSSYCNVIFGLTTVIFVLLSSYMGTQAQALGCGRNYSGVMGRADRMVLLLIITPVQFLVGAIWGVKGADIGIGYRIVPMEVLMGIMLVGGILTTLSRGTDTLIELRRRDALPGKRVRSGPQDSSRWCGPGESGRTPPARLSRGNKGVDGKLFR